ncbi:hypothetical protein ACIPRI_06335 [Variovorax sp. LARHSF232]
MTTTQSTRLPRLACALLLSLTLGGAAMAQQNSSSGQQAAPRYGKVGDSIQRAENSAGRGVANADAATRRGINKGSEAASRPVRNLGDSLGRKLGLGPARSGPPAKGPQSEAP